MPVKTGVGDLEAYTLRLRLDKCFVHLDTEDVRNLTNIVMEELQEYPGKIPVCSPSLSIDHDPILLIAVEPTDQQLCLGRVLTCLLACLFQSFHQDQSRLAGLIDWTLQPDVYSLYLVRLGNLNRER